MSIEASTASGKPTALFDRIYVVSLASSTDRRQYVAGHLTAAGLGGFEFYDATCPDDPAVDQIYSERRVATFPPCFRCGKLSCGDNTCNNVLIRPQVAVFLTYLRLWKRIAERGECALVCEDDVFLHPWFGQVLGLIRQHRDDGTLPFHTDSPALVRLGWAENAEHNPDSPLRISREVRMANPCHLITPLYARALLEEFRRIDHTVDVFMHMNSASARQWSWTAHPPGATELSWSRGTFDSLIHPKNIRTDFLREHGLQDAAAKNEARVRNHVKHLFYRPFLIVGHPRCGTGFTANLLNQMGLDVGHERDGMDGLASWMFAVDDISPYALSPVAVRREALRWGKLIHSVRDISTAVPSIMRDNRFAPPSYAYRRKHILHAYGIDLNALPDNFQRSVTSFLSWNRLIEAMKPDLTFRIEHDHLALGAFVSEHSETGIPADCELDLSAVNADKPYKGVRYEKPVVTAHDWAALPDDVWSDVVSFCQKHGYMVPLRSAAVRPVVTPAITDLAALQRQFLQPSGWSRSTVEQAPMRNDGTPVPWFTFGAIEFLERICRPGDRVFEYGAGNSTLWWQLRVASVTSVEHDPVWIEKIMKRLQPNAVVHHRPRFSPCRPQHDEIVKAFAARMRRTEWPEYDTERVVRRGLDDESFSGYASAIMEQETVFDVIVIDGMARRLCAEFGVRSLAPDGAIILDNSNRRDYDAAFDVLQEAGFRQIPFWGLVPGAPFMTCTSIFTRSLSRLANGAHQTNSLGLPEL